MRAHIEPMKRLYQAGAITDADMDARLVAGKLTQKEYDYIIT